MKLILPVKQYQKLRAYVEATDKEISGLGKMRVMGDSLLVQELRIFEQTVTPAHTVLSANDLAKFYDDLIQADESLGDWKLWWHSHANMATQWSGTDIATINDFDLETDDNNWMVSLLTNLAGDMNIRLDIFKPLRITHDLDCDISFWDDEIRMKASREVDEKVNIKKIKKKKHKKKNKWKKKSGVYRPNKVLDISRDKIPPFTEMIAAASEGGKIKK